MRNKFKSFASDNTSGAHPKIMEALARANAGAARAYGDDDFTEEALAAIRSVFGQSARPYFVFSGTAANVLGLKSLLAPYQALFCCETAHVHTDECGAPEANIGCKLIPLPSRHGKLAVEDCRPFLEQREAVHHNYPAAVSVTQSTECGTVYTLGELKAIRRFCDEHRLLLHMDGARLCNAAAALGLSLSELSGEAGVDVLSFGGAKNGLLFGEAVIFFNERLGRGFEYFRKQHMQLGSKMRFISAQFLEYLKDGLWLENARRANAMAALLAREISGLEHARIVHPVEANAVFIRMHKNYIAKLNERFYFYTFDRKLAPPYPPDWHEARLMTSFDSTEEEVLEFAAAVRACAQPQDV